jgi:arginyl-tRNA synthetase
MVTVIETLRGRLHTALRGLGLPVDQTIQVVPAADPRFGDYQTNAGMVLAKERKENPRLLAERIAQAVDVSGISKPPEVAGPGFINFRLERKFIAAQVIKAYADERLGVAQTDDPKTLVIEFSSPNIAKPMHVGHIRSTVLGDVLARVARFIGHIVVTDNHLGDWGTQFGKVIYGWKNLRDEAALATHPVDELVRLYRAADVAAKEDPGILEACRNELIKLQQGDPENIAIWRKCIELSKTEFAGVYRILGVEFDQQLGESFYNAELSSIVERLLKSGIAEVSEGAVVVWDRTLSDAPFMIRKSDGGFGYAITDAATLDYRVRHWNPDGIWYVVGTPQQLHFQQLFSLARKLGLKLDLQHIGFGSILGEDRKMMRTRSGDSVPLRELLEEAMTRAKALVIEKNPELAQAEVEQIGQIVGIGAIKYTELSQHRLTDYVFSWSKMLSFQGNTAPYLQNAYVRSRSIFRRLKEQFHPPSQVELGDPAEEKLAKKLLQFGEVVPAVLDGFRPNVLANYVYELAAEYHVFYEQCPVLSAETDQKNQRLLLSDLFARTLKLGLRLLGIDVPERM